MKRTSPEYLLGKEVGLVFGGFMEKNEKRGTLKRLREFLTIEESGEESRESEEAKEEKEEKTNNDRIKRESTEPVISNWIKDEQSKLVQFSKTGIVVLSLLLVIFGFYYFGTWSIATSSKAERKLPIYCVDTPEKKVALSFDAAWGNDDTAKILEILEKNGVHVTFFMTGGWVEKYPDDVKAIAAAGHDLGNHSMNHKHMSQLSAAQCQDEIQKVHDKVKELTGVDMKLFRAPYGDYNNTLIESANALGYHVIQWDVDSLDWKNYGVDSIISTVTQHKHLGNGSIILCHNGAKFTAGALELMLEKLKEEGYTVVPISELIYTENYKMDTEGRQHRIEDN